MDEYFRTLVLAVIASFAFGVLVGAAIIGSETLPPAHLTRGEIL